MLQAIYITFSNGGIYGLSRLIQLTGFNDDIQIDQKQKAGLCGVVQTGKWESVSKTVTVWGITKASTEELGPIAKDVESVHAGDHFAKGIFTNNVKSKQTSFESISQAVLTPAFQDEMGEWYVRIEPKLVDIESLPVLQFNVIDTSSSSHLLALVIDGLTGQYGVQNSANQLPKWENRRFSGSQDVREWIDLTVTDYLNSATTA